MMVSKVRFWGGVAVVVCLAAPGVLRAQSNNPAEVYPFASFGLAGASPESFAGKFPGDDLLPYTADDITLPVGGNGGGTWGVAHFDSNSDNKVDAAEHILVTVRNGDDDQAGYSALSRPEYGVIYESEDWIEYWDARLAGPTGAAPVTNTDATDFELNDANGWCSESNAYVYNNLGANQHGLGFPKYRVDYRTTAGAGQTFVYDEIEGWDKSFDFRNTADDPATAFNETGDCRRWFITRAGVEGRGYLIPVDDLPGLKNGSLPTLFGWETVDLAAYLRDTIAPKLTHPDLTIFSPSGLPPTHLYLLQYVVPFDVRNQNGECGGSSDPVCSADPDPALCQVQNHALYWGITPAGNVSTYRSSQVMGFRDDFTGNTFPPEAAVHDWVQSPDDGSKRNLWLQDFFWRDDASHLGNYTFEPATTTWTIVPDPDITVYGGTNDKVLTASAGGTASAPLPKPLGLGENPVEAVADLGEDVTTLPGGGAFQIILRNGNNVIAYADISGLATVVHVGGTYVPATGLAGGPAQSSTPGGGATLGEYNTVAGTAVYTRYILRVTATGVSLRQAETGDYVENDFNDLQSIGTELASLTLASPNTINFQGGISTLSVGSTTLTAPPVVDSLLVFASPGTGPFSRGNANADKKADGSPNLDLSDPVFILNFLFQGGTEPGCKASADVNGDGRLDLSDPISALNFLFQGGARPPAPFPGVAFSQNDGDKLLGCITPHA